MNFNLKAAKWIHKDTAPETFISVYFIQFIFSVLYNLHVLSAAAILAQSCKFVIFNLSEVLILLN